MLRWSAYVVLAGVATSLFSCSPFRKKGKKDPDPNEFSHQSPPQQNLQPVRPMNPGYFGSRRIPPSAGASYGKVNIQAPYIAMTFDDGPHKTNTPRLLDMLRARNIKATFYVVEPNVKRYPHIMQRIIAEGHEVGNHTITHRNMTKLSDQAIRHELSRTHQAIVAATGVPPQTMRPPYGALATRQRHMIRQEFGYPAILWSVDPEGLEKAWGRRSDPAPRQRRAPRRHPPRA